MKIVWSGFPSIPSTCGPNAKSQTPSRKVPNLKNQPTTKTKRTHHFDFQLYNGNEMMNEKKELEALQKT